MTDFIRTCVSVDCVVFGFDGQQLHVLLVQRDFGDSSPGDWKLPGSLIYQEEDADEAAHRVLNELTGIKKVSLKQFKSFTSPDRASEDDMKWVETAYDDKLDRLITISYLSLCRIDRKLNVISKYKTVGWRPIADLPRMPFDHNQIVSESLGEIRRWAEYDPAVMFELLPSKFTATNLRNLYEAVFQKQYDVRNFYKKMLAMEFVLPLDEYQERVTHRAARFFKFDKAAYKKRRRSFD